MICWCIRFPRGGESGFRGSTKAQGVSRNEFRYPGAGFDAKRHPDSARSRRGASVFESASLQYHQSEGAMIPSDLNPTLKTHERKTVRRQRYQKGSLQKRTHGKRKMWVLLYRDGNSKRYVTLGASSEMSKSAAEQRRDEILSEVNART